MFCVFQGELESQDKHASPLLEHENGQAQPATEVKDDNKGGAIKFGLDHRSAGTHYTLSPINFRLRLKFISLLLVLLLLLFLL